MRQFETTALSLLAETSVQMSQQAKTDKERGVADRWANVVGERIDTYIRDDDALLSLMDAWTYLACMSEPSDPSVVKQLSKENSERAMDAADILRDELRSMARRHMPPEDYQRTKREILEYARSNPMGGEAEGARQYTPISATEQGVRLVGALVRTPFIPLTAIGQVGQGAASVKDISASIDRFNDIISTMPEDVRQEVEALLIQHQIDQKFASTILALEETNSTVVSVAAMLEDYPAKLETSATHVIDRTASVQPELRSTLEEGRQTISTINETIDRLDALSESFQETMQTTESAVVELNRLVNPEKKPRSPGEPAPHPFNILEFKQTAEELTGTLTELRKAITDINQFTESGSVEQVATTAAQTAEAAADAAANRFEQLVNYTAWRLAALIVLIFGLLFGYRLVVFVLRRREMSASAS